MLKRLYVHNFKCLQNFEFNTNMLHSLFLLGKNGSGKTTVLEVIEIFQRIGQGVTPIQDLIHNECFSFGNKRMPIDFELEAEIEEKKFHYTLTVEFPEDFIAPRVKSEKLIVDNSPILVRDGGQISLNDRAHFVLDWHHVGLPLVSVRSNDQPIAIFREWLQKIVLLSPYPKYFNSLSKNESETISKNAENLIDWARWLLSSNPSLYVHMHDFLKIRMPDLDLFKFENVGKDDRKLVFIFKEGSDTISLGFEQLSDGEKLFFLAATLIATQKNNPTTLCLWDEPDNFISLIELDHFISESRKAFESFSGKSQLIMTSHNERVINNFSNHNIFVMSRKSHLSPTRIEPLETFSYSSKNIVDAYENGELDS